MRVTYLKRLPIPNTPLPILPALQQWYFHGVEVPDSAGNIEIVSSYYEYRYAAVNPSVDTILIAEMEVGGFQRFRLIKELVGDKLLTKDNWLFGLSNPAELSLYRVAMSSYSLGQIKQVLCASAFRYAIYGAQFSSMWGVLDYIPEPDGIEDYDLCAEQRRVFHYNVDVVSNFIAGVMPDGYTEMAYGILEEGI